MIMLRTMINRRLTFTLISRITSTSLAKADRCNKTTDYAF